MSIEVDALDLTRLGTVGTSIGALVGGLYAREGDLITSSARAKQFSGRMGNIWRLLSDMTYPIVAYTTVSSQMVATHPVLISWIRDTSSTEQYGRRSTISTSKICGCHSSAIPPTLSPPGCRFTKQDTPGGISVSGE